MKKVAVLINFYKKELTSEEIISLKSCISKLKNHNLFFLGPDNIDLTEYKKNAPDVNFHLVPPIFFKGAINYSRYLLSENLYKDFKDFDFILIYQLDCFIFRDELDFWASKDYDFVGSPLFENFEENENFQFLGVGNGGLSIRNVKNIYKLLNSWEKQTPYLGIVKSKYLAGIQYKLGLVFYKFISSLTGYKYHRPLNSILNNHNDDIILGLFYSKELGILKTPTPLEASRFSTEIHSEYLYEKNNRSLPMGCHAWQKYEPEFWSRHINTETENNN